VRSSYLAEWLAREASVLTVAGIQGSAYGDARAKVGIAPEQYGYKLGRVDGSPVLGLLAGGDPALPVTVCLPGHIA
jgi:hypothetical protein